MNWDHLKVFAAVAEHGSLSAAARVLKISPPTASRHIQALEYDLGSKLFDKTREGYMLTAAGADILTYAREMEQAAEGLERRKAAFAHAELGTVRIAAGNWMSLFLIQHTNEIRKDLPGLELEIFNTYAFANLARRDADLALRNRRPDQGRLAVRHLIPPCYAVYGHRDYVSAHPEAKTEDSYRACSWVGFDEANAHLPTARWLTERMDASPALRCTQAINILDGIRASAGLGILPCFAGDTDPDLMRLSPIIHHDKNDLWLVIHEDLRRAPAVRAVADRIVELIRKYRKVLAPED